MKIRSMIKRNIKELKVKKEFLFIQLLASTVKCMSVKKEVNH